MTGSSVGVDVGGTFTDLVVRAPSGRLSSGKVPTTPADPALGVMPGLTALLGTERPASVAHGTTIVTNAIIEGRGAVVGLITTRGFRDVLEIARQNRYRTGAAATGEIVAQQIELLADAGAYAYLSALVLLYSTVTAAGPYRVPAVEVEARVVYTNNPPTSAMRGFGAMQTVFAYESQMDRVARALGLDPLEIRRTNALRRGDTLPVGQVIETHVALPELCERAWTALGPPRPPRAPHVRVGRGLACNFQPYGRIVWLHDWASAWVGFEMDGSLVVRCGVPDVGGGQAASLCQIAAEVLGVSLERICVHISDSALTPLAGTTTASRQLYMSGNAVLKTARELRAQLVRVAAAMLGGDAADLDMADDRVVAADGRTLAMPDLLRECARAGVPRSHLGVYHAPAGEPVDLATGSGKVFPDYTFGAHAAEVEVDTETGVVRVLGYAAAHDVGRAINPGSSPFRVGDFGMISHLREHAGEDLEA